MITKMDLEYIVESFGLQKEYKLAVDDIGAEHTCNQGCGEGWCQRNEDKHQRHLITMMSSHINK